MLDSLSRELRMIEASNFGRRGLQQPPAATFLPQAMNSRLPIPAVLVTALLLVSCATAPPEGAWLLLGSRAPNFSLPNQHGGQISLADYRGQKNVVVVFSRAYR